MYRNVCKVIALVLVLTFIGCGRKNVRYETYQQKQVIEPGPFQDCWWLGQVEVCKWENVICRRNWMLIKPRPICTRN